MHNRRFGFLEVGHELVYCAVERAFFVVGYGQEVRVQVVAALFSARVPNDETGADST